MVNVNLHSKKRVYSLFTFFVVIGISLGIILMGKFILAKGFESRLNQIAYIKGYLLDSVGIILTGVPKIDASAISTKRNELVVEQAKLARRVSELKKHIRSKEKEILFFKTLEAFLEDQNAIRSIVTRLDYEGGTGVAYYYLIYDRDSKTTVPSPALKPSTPYQLNLKGEMEFSNLYILKLYELKVGDGID
ncbi:hypothetical protein [Kosmotoga sp. DU53]|uniref:hypothetical protein n=1 Tax=Kosmotoga sp. DU53 TaxID=1310160 RepID=UPI0007C56B2A|nr:hypothetical protein [Kosmotoga sp. DU53]MDI3523324.1 hypothetical protein [Kosmotoga sp.]MDK2953546.1 hypothetical protein [Kosmotoga sp.]OAA19414.1 hypothetical protein DU53_10195 [Kosmotoga sp. DU53]